MNVVVEPFDATYPEAAMRIQEWLTTHRGHAISLTVRGGYALTFHCMRTADRGADAEVDYLDLGQIILRAEGVIAEHD